MSTNQNVENESKNEKARARRYAAKVKVQLNQALRSVGIRVTAVTQEQVTLYIEQGLVGNRHVERVQQALAATGLHCENWMFFATSRELVFVLKEVA